MLVLRLTELPSNQRRERGTGDDALLTAIADGNAGFTAYRAADEDEGRGTWDDALLSPIFESD